jgi:competence protein ComEA
MNRFRQLWLNFTSAERKGIIIVAFLCMLIVSVSWWFPDTRSITVISDDSLNRIIYNLALPQKVYPNQAPFNPDSADSATWVNAGLKPYQARTIVRYLQKGGSIRTVNDLWKIYFMDSVLYEHLSKILILDSVKYEQNTTDNNNYVRNKESKKYNTVELNASDSIQLIQLPGIGPVLAGRIIRFRKLLGGYYTVEQLREVYGLVDHLTPELQSLIKVDPSLIKRIDVKNAEFKELVHHPYIGYNNAKALFKLRKENALSAENIRNAIGEEQFIKLSHYLDNP